MNKSHKISSKFAITLSLLLFAFLAIWHIYITPKLLNLPSNFNYNLEIFSLDNLYDEDQNKFKGEERSVTTFSYETVEEKDGTLILENVFHVKAVTGENIVEIKRNYGIDRASGKHIAGYGDKDREGYLFAPKNLKKDQGFTYWHINYDAPAKMQFVKEQTLFGLQVYKYETKYEGITIDQTEDLKFLPEVGDTRGVEIEIHLETWVEPVTGRMISYQDHATAYYYNLQTGERQNPWNKFSNKVEQSSIQEQVNIARYEKMQTKLVNYGIPSLIILFTLFTLFLIYRKLLAILILVSGMLGVGAFTLSDYFFKVTVDQNISSETNHQIIIADGQQPAFGLIYISERNGYFKDQNLDIQYRHFTSGRDALNDALSGNSDIATVYETPVVINTLSGKEVAIITELHHSTRSTGLIARKDSGIEELSDLRGKKIGVTKNTNAEFALFKLLDQEGISISEVQLIPTPPDKMSASILQGKVDAAATWNPHLHSIRNSDIKENLTTFFSDEYKETSVLAGESANVLEKEEALKKFMIALKKAEDFLAENPDESRNIIAKHLSFLDTETIKEIWPDFDIELRLSTVLLSILEQEAAWFINNTDLEYTNTAPSFRSVFFTDYLRSVKPESISIYQ